MRILPNRVMRRPRPCGTIAGMTSSLLSSFSNELADRVAAASPFVVQVAGARRPASGVVHADGTILTTARALGREDGLHVRLGDGTALEADLAGWDPSTGIAVVRPRSPVPLQPPPASQDLPRAGEVVFAIARSWSNALTASAGIVAVVGGPLKTGRRRQIGQVIRVTAPMHDGFAGGGVFDAGGRLVGLATAAEIRGFGVVIPAAIALSSASRVLATGTPRRGFLGVAVQPAALPPSQRAPGRERALVVVGVTPSSPAEAAGILVGDVLLDVDGTTTENPDDLLDLLSARAGQVVSARMLRGGTPRDVQVTVGTRPPG
jgi:S1-C subfamily serine protease